MNWILILNKGIWGLYYTVGWIIRFVQRIFYPYSQAFDITKDLFNGIDLTTSDQLWLENADDVPENRIVTSKRIGIEGAGAEVANKLYRFYEICNSHVSVRDKSSESLIQNKA